MRNALIILSVLCLLPVIAAAQSQDASSILGFSDASAQKELAVEKRFAAIPDPTRMRSYMKLLSARPHNVGSPYDKQNAEWILAQYKKWGWDAHIETFYPLYPTPKVRVLTMGSYHPKLKEPPIPGEPSTYLTSEEVPTENVYSPDGDVTAPIVYVNYGRIQDYEQLARYGISVKGKIVIVRYGKIWRGEKPKIAALNGAIGCIIYSDPADDGYAVNTVLPKGPMRPPEGVQRGSVMEAELYPGDPLTPGIGATKNAKRLPISQAKTIAKIPTMPISYGDAQPLLEDLGGPPVPVDWRGALPITYRIGPSKQKVHLKLAFNWDLAPVYNVVATLRGSQNPDIWVLRGNHHDAWVTGADDPVSAQVAMLEEGRAIGELAKTGWRPKRTLVYLAWDGEEPMQIGSVEWAEEHATELREKAALYLNSDSNERGYFRASGSQSLETMIDQVARTITDPETGASAWQRLRADMLLNGTPGERKDAAAGNALPIGPLGMGSDFIAFLDHLGIATASASYGGEQPRADGVYHSAYDTFYWYTHFCKDCFEYGRAMAQTDGKIVLRMAEADILPYDFTALARSLHRYNQETKDLLKSRQKEAKDRQVATSLDAYKLTSNPAQPTPVAPPAIKTPPNLDFTPIDNAIAALNKSGAHFNRARADALRAGVSDAQLKTVNEELALAARKLQYSKGLPRRPWYQNLIMAPGWFKGYGATTMPGVYEAIEQQRYPEATEQIGILSRAIQNEADYVEHIADQLDQLAGHNSNSGA
jgi:N-acetylated-alpha-linked acidic dipeptidase